MSHWLLTAATVPPLLLALLVPTPARNGARPHRGTSRAPRVDAADSVLRRVKAHLADNITPGVDISNVQIPSQTWKQNGEVTWGAVQPVGSPKLIAGALMQYDYAVSKDLDPAKAGKLTHAFELSMEEVRSWSFSTSRTETTSLEVNVDVKYPLGGVGQLHVNTDFKETLTTTSNSSASETDRMEWKETETIEIGPNQTAWGRLIISKQPFVVPWSVEMAATGEYHFWLRGDMFSLTRAEAALRKVDDSVVCFGGFLGPNVRACTGTVWKLVPWRERHFTVKGELRVEYGISVRACTEAVPLQKPSVACKI